jgi:hypothetical protein
MTGADSVKSWRGIELADEPGRCGASVDGGEVLRAGVR